MLPFTGYKFGLLFVCLSVNPEVRQGKPVRIKAAPFMRKYAARVLGSCAS